MLINEMFMTLQGEGATSGFPTFFVRTGRCNLKCAWCDTKFEEPVTDLTVAHIIGEIGRMKAKYVCITGGEPLLDPDFRSLEDNLLKAGRVVIIETNGSLSVKDCKGIISMDIKPPSSGMADSFLVENLDYLKDTDQIKFVIADSVDYEYAKRMLKKVKKGEVVFMPVWEKDLTVAKRIAEWIIKDRLTVRLSLQIHKILNLR